MQLLLASLAVLVLLGPACAHAASGAAAGQQSTDKREGSWAQPDGFVPVPEPTMLMAAPAEAPGLPPANNFGLLADTTQQATARDPLGSNVYADNRFAPSNVRDVLDSLQQPAAEAAAPATPSFIGGDASLGGMGAGVGAGSAGLGGASNAGMGAGAYMGGVSNTGVGGGYMGGGGMAAGGVSASAALGDTTGAVGGLGATPPDASLGGMGGYGMGAGAGAGPGMGAGMAGAGVGGAGVGGAAAAGTSDVFAPSAGSGGFNNKYTPSVGNAIGSSDLLVKMTIEAPEQDVAQAGDALRALMGQFSNTKPNNIFVYNTRTINPPNGQPTTALTYLFKNNLDAERSRQSNTFSNPDIMKGFAATVNRATRLKIEPGSIKVSSAVNDGGAVSTMGASAGMLQPGGQVAPGTPGLMLPGAQQTGGGMMPVNGGYGGANGMMGQQSGMGPPGLPAKSSAAATGASAAAAVLLAAAVALL